MTRPSLSFVVALGMVLSVAPAVVAQPAAHRVGPPVMRLHDGRNALDVLGNGSTGEVDVAARGNFNAHGHHVAMFLVHAPSEPGHPHSPAAWQVVPFFGAHRDALASDELFGTSEGADCTLRDLRVIAGGVNKPVTVVVGERDFGGSYADSAAVRFTYYELRVNREETVGYPAYWFSPARVVQAKGRYCDVDDAFDRELGLGRVGLVKWDGPR